MNKLTKTITVALACSILATSMSAFADRDDHRRGGWDRHDGRGGWHGDIRHFHDRDFDHWRGGHWSHEYHNGRWGWWWVIPTLGLWYWYAQPAYPYPNPYVPPVVVQRPNPPRAQSYYYYCPD